MRIGKWKIKRAPVWSRPFFYTTVWPDGGNEETGETNWILGIINIGPIQIVRVSR